MLGFCRGDARHRCRTGIMGLASFLVLVWIGSGTDHAWWSPPSASRCRRWASGVVSGVFVAGAGCAALVTWRRHVGAVAGWIVATGALVAAQALVVTLHRAAQHAAARDDRRSCSCWRSAIVGMLGVVVPLLAPERVRRVADETLRHRSRAGTRGSRTPAAQFPRVHRRRRRCSCSSGSCSAPSCCQPSLVLQQRAASRPMSALLLVTVGVVDPRPAGPAVRSRRRPHRRRPRGSLRRRSRCRLARHRLGHLRRNLEDERRRIESLRARARRRHP